MNLDHNLFIHSLFLDQKAPKLNLETDQTVNTIFEEKFVKNNKVDRKIIKPNDNELELHKAYLKTSLSKNYYK